MMNLRVLGERPDGAVLIDVGGLAVLLHGRLVSPANDLDAFAAYGPWQDVTGVKAPDRLVLQRRLETARVAPLPQLRMLDNPGGVNQYGGPYSGEGGAGNKEDPTGERDRVGSDPERAQKEKQPAFPKSLDEDRPMGRTHENKPDPPKSAVKAALRVGQGVHTVGSYAPEDAERHAVTAGNQLTKAGFEHTGSPKAGGGQFHFYEHEDGRKATVAHHPTQGKTGSRTVTIRTSTPRSAPQQGGIGTTRGDNARMVRHEQQEAGGEDKEKAARDARYKAAVNAKPWSPPLGDYRRG